MLWAQRLYCWLLHLYPAGFRNEYGALMAQAFRDQCRAVGQRGTPDWMALWWRTLADVVRTAAAEHLAAQKGSTIRMYTGLERSQALIFIVPTLLSGLIYLLIPDTATQNNIPLLLFLVLAVTGPAGLIVARLGIFPGGRIWLQYSLGFAQGVLAFLIFALYLSEHVSLYRQDSVNYVVVLLLLSLPVIFLLERIIGRRTRTFWLAVIGLALFALFYVWLQLKISPELRYNPVWSVRVTLLNQAGQSLMLLFITALTMRLARKQGISALLAGVVALGLMYLPWWGDAPGFSDYGPVIVLIGMFVPLLIVPAWLVFIPFWRLKKYGALLIWALMVVAMAIIIASPRKQLVNIANFSHPFFGLWLVLALYEKLYLKPGPGLMEAAPIERMTDSPSDFGDRSVIAS